MLADTADWSKCVGSECVDIGLDVFYQAQRSDVPSHRVSLDPGRLWRVAQDAVSHWNLSECSVLAAMTQQLCWPLDHLDT